MTQAHDINFDSYLPEGQSLKDFQHVGVAYAVFQSNDGKGAMIGDEMGLGKTPQGITTVKVHAAAHSLPVKALFVVPPSIKENWAKEIARFAPEWDVQILSGKRPYALTGNVAIIGYNLLSTWAKALITEGFNQIVLDESHKVKDPTTQQTKAALKVCADIRDRKGLVLLLTGTAILNRPVELVPQLQMMGRLQDIAPLPRYGTTERDWEFSFKNTFCAPKKVYRGGRSYTEYTGGSRLDLLNARSRNEFLIRRLRNEVLDMEDTHRVQVDLSLNGDLAPYWDLEKNFQGSGKPESFILELLTALRQSVAQCKIPAAVEWVEDFLADNEGKKLVVWAHHKDVQAGIAAALNDKGIETIHWYGEQEQGRLEEAKDRFNHGTAQVIVASLAAHGFGHTLTGTGHNVTDCLFVERPWHPGAVTQAEDRINRIGQEADAVFAHTLVVPGTVDVWLEDLIQGKWLTFKAAIDGTISDAETRALQAEVMEKLAAHLLAKYGEGRIPTM